MARPTESGLESDWLMIWLALGQDAPCKNLSAAIRDLLPRLNRQHRKDADGRPAPVKERGIVSDKAIEQIRAGAAGGRPMSQNEMIARAIGGRRRKVWTERTVRQCYLQRLLLEGRPERRRMLALWHSFPTT